MPKNPGEIPALGTARYYGYGKKPGAGFGAGARHGANDYLAKPFYKEEFLARVKTHLNLHHINEATSKFVPNEFLRSLGRDNITEVLLGDHVEREVTVLFADIRDYTTLSESMMPEENFNFVKAFNGRMDPVTQQYKGFVNQYLGDGIMAIFPGSPADALQASVAMQTELAAYNVYRATKGRKPIRVGIGMHTGSLIMGIIGDERRLDAATISDAVNTASRLESLSKYYGANIIISKDSLDKIEGIDGAVQDQWAEGFQVRYLGMVQVKGKHKAVKVHECFDGDNPVVFEKKLATLEVFTVGMQHYLDKQFVAAVAAFEAVLQRRPDDATARLFLKKAQHFAAHGAPEEWTGVEMMEGK